jgi:hypothetical protein
MGPRTWLEALDSFSFVYEAVFPLEPKEREIYKDLLLYAADMDEEGLRRVLDAGGRKLLLRYSKEEYLYGIHLFLKDLSELWKAFFADRSREEFYRYMSQYVEWSKEVGLNNVVDWIKHTPEYPEYVEAYRSYYWVGVYRLAVHSLPPSLREVLDPVARLIADFQVERELVWMGEGSEEEKAQKVADLFIRFRSDIGQRLIELGLPLEVASPLGFNLEAIGSLVQEGFPYETNLAKRHP